MIFEIAMGIFIVLILVADMVTKNKPKPPQEPPPELWLLYYDTLDDDMDD